MPGRKNWILTIIFFGAFGFALGVICLFMVNVPVEEILKRQKVSQVVINITMSGIILVWAGSVVTATVAFHRYIALIPERRRLARVLLFLLIVIAGGIFVLLLSTDNKLVTTFQGSQDNRGSKYMIGPYPEDERLQQLKKEGYEGIISLLSPTIPFEKLLLDREMQAGEKIGLRIYSFPMLPWISGNESSLNGIKELVGKEKGPFYIHCYLGKHRADLVASTIFGAVEMYLYPDRLERGRLNYYQDGRVILGPYPSDEEWFHLVRRGLVKEIISYLDPENSEEALLIEKEKKLCAENGLEFKLLPVRVQGNQVTGLAEVLGQVAASKNKIFIHGFGVDAKSKMIDASLRGGVAVSSVLSLPYQLSGGNTYPINQNLILGPKLNAAENAMLKADGFNCIVMPQEGNLSPVGASRAILAELKGKKGAFYISGFQSEKDLELIQHVLLARFYGIDKVNMRVSGQDITVMGRYLLIGLMPGPEELNALALQGIATILYPQEADKKPDQRLRDSQKMVEEQGLNFQIVRYEDGNVDGMLEAASRDSNPCYIAANSRQRMEIAQDIEAAKLIQ